MLGCVKEYYSPTGHPLTGISGCINCADQMGIEKDELNCLACHKKCFDRYNSRQLSRITNIKNITMHNEKIGGI